MAIPINEIEEVLRNSEYSSAYCLDHKPKNLNMGIREWYLSNEAIKIRTMPIPLPPKESSNVSKLKIYTEATKNHDFGSTAKKIARDADVDIAITPDPEFFDSEKIEEDSAFRYLFFVDIRNADDLLDGIKSVESAYRLLYPHLYHKKFINI